MVNRWLSIGAGLMALAVLLGAFGAHGLRGRIDPYLLTVYEKAVFYHFIHALGILIVALALATKWPKENWACRAVTLFLLGIVLFSGSLYLLAVTGQKWLGMVTPFGGIAYILGWISLAIAANRHS